MRRLALAVCLFLWLGATPAYANDEVVLTDGHVDGVAPRLVDGQLQIQVKDSTTIGKVAWREPGQVVFHAGPASSVTLPDNAALAFLGRPGARVFLLPQVQQKGLLWLGWDTEELNQSQFTGNLTWKLNKIEGPGRFALFLTDSFGAPSTIFSSANRLPETTDLATGTHTHANWAFTAAGVYRLTFEVNGTRENGQVVSDTEVYTFAIGVDPPPKGIPWWPIAAGIAILVLVVALFVWWRRRA